MSPAVGFRLNLAAVRLDDAARDGKPQPRPARGRGCGISRRDRNVRRCVEGLPGGCLRPYRRRSLPRPSPVRLRTHLYLPSGWRMPQCVADQVVEHTPDALRIHQDGVNIRGSTLPSSITLLTLSQFGKRFRAYPRSGRPGMIGCRVKRECRPYPTAPSGKGHRSGRKANAHRAARCPDTA